jgi:hypothetical protein
MKHSDLIIRVIDNRENRLVKMVPVLEQIVNQAVAQGLEGFKKGTMNSGKTYYICNPFFDMPTSEYFHLYMSIIVDSKIKKFNSVMFLID